MGRTRRAWSSSLTPATPPVGLLMTVTQVSLLKLGQMEAAGAERNATASGCAGLWGAVPSDQAAQKQSWFSRQHRITRSVQRLDNILTPWGTPHGTRACHLQVWTPTFAVNTD